MRLKGLVASALLGSMLFTGFALPVYSATNDVSASVININYEASSVNMDGIKAFVTRMYDVCLNRTPDTEGLNGWANQLKNKEATGCSVAYGFVFSPEFVSKNPSNEEFVKYMYDAFFGRTPDDAGLKYWVDLLNGGASKEFVFSGFSNSQEFSNLCANYGVVKGFHIEGYNFNQIAQVNLFVERLYNVVLNRSCDEGGMAGWTTKLINHEESGCSVAYGFVFSPEFLNRKTCNNCYVEILYNAFLGRSSDSKGKASWVGQLNNGATRESVFGGFSGSVEFANICASYGIDAGSLDGINSKTYGGGTCTVCGTNVAVTVPTNTTTSTTTPTPSNGENSGASATVTSTPDPTIVPKDYSFLKGQYDKNNIRSGLVYIYNNTKHYDDIDFYCLDENLNIVTGWVHNPNVNYQNGDYEVREASYYFDVETGKAVSGLQEIDGNWYYFDDEYHHQCFGRLKDGISGNYYFFDLETGVICYGWCQEEYYGDTYNYYADPQTGIMVNGWQNIDGHKYYFIDGWRASDLFYTIDDKDYYFDSEGNSAYGLITKKHKSTGTLLGIYYINEDHTPVRGWKTIDGVKYYFKDYCGAAFDEIICIDGYYYIFDGGGKSTLAQAGWMKFAGNKYYFVDSQTKATGWYTINGKKYHFSPSGALDTGLVLIDGRYYCFDGNGLPNAQGYTYWLPTKVYYYFDSEGGAYTGFFTMYKTLYYANSEGTLQSGWQTVDGKKYYVNKGIVSIGLTKIDSKSYYFDSNGVMLTGWQTIYDNRYYFGDDGAMIISDWQSIVTDNKTCWYYFDDNGVFVKDGWKEINNKWYFFTESGIMLTGWHDELDKDNNKVWYYLNTNGTMQTGWGKIDDKWYFFESSGKMKTGWHKNSTGKWFYLKASGEACISEFYQISGKWYYFDSMGVMATSNVTVDQKTYTIDSSGVVTNY